MSQTIYFRHGASRYFRLEVLKEFATNRFSLNHYEFVDFTVFEYGERVLYLKWRLFSLLVFILLTIHALFSEIEETPGARTLSRFIYMHIWLALLVTLHTLLEVVSLTWVFCNIPSPILVRINYTPWNFKCLWLMYNMLYPNLMACNIVYHLIVKNMEQTLGESRLFIALIASLVGIHVSVTAIPSRLAHIVHPLLLNILHIIFTIVYQAYGNTDTSEHNYVYMEMDWLNSRQSAVRSALLWLLVTTCCHLLMVCCCWFRRLIYRHQRSMDSVPVLGLSSEVFNLKDDSDRLDHFEIYHNDKAEPSDSLVESAYIKKKQAYSPHMSYREKLVPTQLEHEIPSKHCLDNSQKYTTSCLHRNRVNGRHLGSNIVCKKGGTHVFQKRGRSAFTGNKYKYTAAGRYKMQKKKKQYRKRSLLKHRINVRKSTLQVSQDSTHTSTRDNIASEDTKQLTSSQTSESVTNSCERLGTNESIMRRTR